MDFYPNEIINKGVVKLRIDAVGGDLDRVVCKYPRSFMDEMARQLTEEIETALGVKGLADSSLQLVMVFAPNTYLEHICENVTYRRLMLLDKVSAPRDFWIKWTRLAGEISEYSADNIRFELGEDVEQKIREKEYRYLLTSGNEKYHNAMGRRKVTEWREVIKRAAKRGDLTKVETDFELAPETLELEERIADLLGKRPTAVKEEAKEEIPYITPENDDFVRAMEKARMVVAEIAEAADEEETVSFDELTELTELAEEETEAEPEVEIEVEIEIDDVETDDEPGEDIEKILFENEDYSEDEDAEEEIEEIEEEMEEFEETEDDEAEEAEEEISESEPSVPDFLLELSRDLSEAENIVDKVTEPEIEPEIEAEPKIEEAPIIPEAVKPTDTEPKQISILEETAEPVRYYDTPIADRAADIRAEIETKIRLEYESRARMKAEAELVALRREQERLRMEKEALEAEAKKEQERLIREYELLRLKTQRAEEERAAREAQRRAEEEKLREQIEAQLRHEARERERLAEAARMAIEEQHRLEAENARIARMREEEERIEAEKRRREREEAELEALRRAEIERIRREDEEAKERARSAMPEMGDGRYSYTSKSVKFLFRKSVDPNITNRIYEIIKATVEYYGKDSVYLKIRATVPDSQTVVLDFEHIPIEEMELLGNIIKILGNSGLGIAKAIIE